MEKIQKDKLIKYWRDGAKKSLELANCVMRNGYYDHALFCGHLALEKLLKSMMVEETNSSAPRSHDLLYLAGLVKMDLSSEQRKALVEINTFNIAGRYFEEKLEFHKRISKSKAVKWLKIINEMYLWLSKRRGKN